MKGRLNQRVYAANAMLTALDFEKLGFWEDTTPEENITVYGMDFNDDYILLTDEDGKTVWIPKNLSSWPLMTKRIASCGVWS